MPNFLITAADGHKFKVTAPDQETAAAYFRSVIANAVPDGTPAPSALSAGLGVAQGSPDETTPPTTQQSYDAALGALHRSQFPQMDDAQFADYANKTFAPDLGALASQGTTFGLADEIDSGLGALGSGARQLFGGGGPGLGAYSDYQKMEDARLALAREKTGIAGSAVELGTGLATLGPERAGLDALVSGVRTMAPKAAPTLLKTALTSGGTGAVLGGIGGFTGTSGDVSHRLLGSAEGALGGAAVGAVVPVLAQGISSGVDKVTQALAARNAAQQLGIDPEAAKFLQTRLAADDSLSPAGQARMAQAGPEAMLADAGPSARNTLDYAIQSSGRAGNVATDAIGQRVSRDSAAINSVLDQTLGQPVGQDTARADIRSGSSATRDAAYKTAYAQPIDYSSEDGRDLEDLLQRVPQQAISRANNLMKVEGVKSSQIMAQIADDGSVTFKKMPDVRQLDYITRALNEEAKNGMGAGAMGGQTALGGALQNLSGEIRDTLKLHVPEYGDALAVGQDTIRQSQAVKDGYDLLSPSTTREDVAAQARNYTPQERAAAAQGIRSKIDDATANVTRTLSDGNMDAREALKSLRDLSSRGNRDKVASVIGQQQADALFAELDRATRSFELRASVADNSKTFQRQEMNRQVDAVTNPGGIVPTILRGEPVNAAKRGIQLFTGMTPERALSRKDAMMQDVVRALVAQGPDALSTANALSKLGVQRAGASKVAEALLRTGAIGQPLAYQIGQQVGGMQQ